MLGLAPLLAACGDDDEPGTSTSTQTEETPSDTGSPSPSASDEGAGELVAAADVPVGGGVVLEEQKVVVTQPAEGEFMAFTAVCTHQGCLVGSVKDNTINCPCHGSQFSAEDGSVVTGPATAPLEAVGVAVDGDSVIRA